MKIPLFPKRSKVLFSKPKCIFPTIHIWFPIKEKGRNPDANRGISFFPEANSRVIDRQLKELETCGIIKKKIYEKLLPHSEYSITPPGSTLIPVVKQLEK